VEQFSVLSNVDKLRMVEEAVGLEPFRNNVVQAKTKLTRILTQEESVGKLLEQAQQTLNYWRQQYEKFQEKKQLKLKRDFLNRELSWAEVERREEIVKSLQARIQKSQLALSKIEADRQAVLDDLNSKIEQQQKLKSETKDSFDQRLSLEREVAKNQTIIELLDQFYLETQVIETSIAKDKLKLLRIENLKELTKTSKINIQKAVAQIKENQTNLSDLEELIDKISIDISKQHVNLSLLDFKHTQAVNELNIVEKSLKESEQNLEVSVAKAEQLGARVAVLKSSNELQAEISLTDGHLAALSNVSEEIEQHYISYSKLYLELKEKAQLVAENREKTLEEVKTRIQAWRTVMEQLLSRVNLEYQRIMNQTLATGEVLLSNSNDIETAGLEIYVGFKGSKPVALDAYTQSGGERTTATMGFLLALQQHVRSPFRAVDEYDIHMDPKNREMIAKVLVSMIKDANSQYIVITPSQITFAQQDANVITVQNLEGKSLVREVA